jgi:hypothetical protein
MYTKSIHKKNTRTHTLFLAPPLCGALSFVCGTLSQHKTKQHQRQQQQRGTRHNHTNTTTTTTILHLGLYATTAMDTFGNCPLRYCPDTVLSVLDWKGQWGEYPTTKIQQSATILGWKRQNVVCGQCSMKWHICTLCTALRVHIRGLSNL